MIYINQIEVCHRHSLELDLVTWPLPIISYYQRINDIEDHGNLEAK